MGAINLSNLYEQMQQEMLQQRKYGASAFIHPGTKECSATSSVKTSHRIVHILGKVLTYGSKWHGTMLLTHDLKKCYVPMGSMQLSLRVNV